MPPIAFYECSKCGHQLSGDTLPTLCPKDTGVLYVRYDFARLKPSRKSVQSGPASMWRYSYVLPDAPPVTLDEGFTPLLPSRKFQNVWIKDESLNPTGSFKARGLSMAVTMAKHFGVKKIAIPSAGNAGGALAAYAAIAGIEAHVFMPKDVPVANELECRAYGAHVTLVDGLISDCARLIAEQKDQEGWFDFSTLKEPFRVEGKKTMGYEIAEQIGWSVPDAIIYPTGGGVGMIGMWKAFDEMERLGWVPKAKRPKMISVQASGCAPIVKAFEEGKNTSEVWPNPETISAGLRVPKAYGDYLVLDILRESGGTAISITDGETIDSLKEWSRDEGIFAAPEGAASLAAYKKLLAEGALKKDERVVLFNTGSGMKYLDVLSKSFDLHRHAPRELPASRNIGGIIGPY